MSKQLTLSSIIAVFAMLATALIATVGPVEADRSSPSHSPLVQQVSDPVATS